jgi:hypothetical protein
MIFDPMYLLFIAPAFLLSLWASFRTKSTFMKYSKVLAASGMTGAQAAQRLLDTAGIVDVEVVATRGVLSDHYNPMTKKLALSEPVYGSRSIAAIGVACHEAGHAIQHARGYKPLWLRSALVPLAGIGSKLGYIVMIVGLMMVYAAGTGGAMGQNVVLLGAVLFSMTLLFQVITLPVEFDATARAKRLAVEHGLVLPQERQGMDRVLNAAALTYVAAAISTLMTLVYFLFRAGLLGGRRG